MRGSVAATARSIERPLMRCLELLAAALVAADIAILLIGVIARYVFRSPLIWTDELAQAVFLWLGMIGAIVALNRGEHMRMTALVVRAAPRTATGPGGIRRCRGPGVPGGGDPACHRIRPGGDADRDAGPWRLQGLADRAAAVRLRHDADRRRDPAVPRLSRRPGARADRRGSRGGSVRPDGGPVAGEPRQPEPDPVLHRPGRRRRAGRRADRHRLRRWHLRLHGADHRRADAAVRRPVL